MDIGKLANDMIGEASRVAGNAWSKIQVIAINEFKTLANRIADISVALAAGQMKPATARILFRNARSQIVATLALLSTIIAAAAEKIVRSALNIIKGAVNGAIGFQLIS